MECNFFQYCYSRVTIKHWMERVYVRGHLYAWVPIKVERLFLKRYICAAIVHALKKKKKIYIYI